MLENDRHQSVKQNHNNNSFRQEMMLEDHVSDEIIAQRNASL